MKKSQLNGYIGHCNTAIFLKNCHNFFLKLKYNDHRKNYKYKPMFTFRIILNIEIYSMSKELFSNIFLRQNLKKKI